MQCIPALKFKRCKNVKDPKACTEFAVQLSNNHAVDTKRSQGNWSNDKMELTEGFLIRDNDNGIKDRLMKNSKTPNKNTLNRSNNMSFIDGKIKSSTCYLSCSPAVDLTDSKLERHLGARRSCNITNSLEDS